MRFEIRSGERIIDKNICDGMEIKVFYTLYVNEEEVYYGSLQECLDKIGKYAYLRYKEEIEG